jgi:hypothetical protein
MQEPLPTRHDSSEPPSGAGAPLAAAGVAEVFLAVRPPADDGRVLVEIAEETTVVEEDAQAGGRVQQDAAVTRSDGAVVARLGAFAAASEGAHAGIAGSLDLTLSVTNTGTEEQPQVTLGLAWSAARPGHAPDGPWGGIFAAGARVEDGRRVVARFESSVAGPGVADSKQAATDEPWPSDLACGQASLPGAGRACFVRSPDVSEGTLTLLDMRPGETRRLSWRLRARATAGPLGGSPVA